MKQSILRQKLWRWLDQRQRFGFTRLTSKSLESLLTLSAVAEDKELGRLASMALQVQIWELRNLFWEQVERKKQNAAITL